MEALEAQVAEGLVRLKEMEEQRNKAEKEGRWTDAQCWHDRMRDFNLKQGKRLQKASRHAFDVEKADLLAKQQTEVNELVEVWSKRMQEYEFQAKELLDFTRKKHLEDEEKELKEMRKQVYSRKIIHSKHVLESRLHIDRLLKQRKYSEAEELRSELLPIEQEEERRFKDELRAQCKRKEQAIRSSKDTEMNALVQRVKSGRRELKIQRKVDLERLLQSHQNAINHLEQRSRIHQSKTRDWVSRQLLVQDKSPSKYAIPVTGEKPAYNGFPSPHVKTPRGLADSCGRAATHGALYA